MFDYIKLFVENFSAWPLILIVVMWWLARNPEKLSVLTRHISGVKFGILEVQLRDLESQVKEAKEQIATLENEVERKDEEFRTLTEGIDINASRSALASTRQSLRATALAMNDLTSLHAWLAEEASPEQIYAAAEALRARRDPAFFDDIVTCLGRLASDPDLKGIRLYTVWTLTSALHRMLLADVKHALDPVLSRDQLQAARSVLQQLERHPRVLADRPDDPMKGVRGPVKWAKDWIEKALDRMKNGQE